MYLIIKILVWIFLIYPVLVSGQSIMAGQNSGTNIVYHDIDDLHIDSPDWNTSDAEYMDLNEDGIIDLKLMTDFTYWSHLNYMSISAAADASDDCQYSTLADHPNWIRKHGSWDVIDSSLNWYTEPIPLLGGTFFKEYTSKVTEGVFTGEGYMAYRICGIDTTYGWIRIYCNGAHLTVYDYAYQSASAGISQVTELAAHPSFHVKADQLIVEIPEEIYDASGLIDCYDLSGRIIFQLRPKPGMNHFYISGYRHGLYILRLNDRSGRSFAGKIVL
jgi:hypothetical protein